MKVLKSGGLITIQDKGRIGYRRFGIPQSGAIDPVGMQMVNRAVGNEPDGPVIEYALSSLTLEAIEKSVLSVYGAAIKINNVASKFNTITVSKGDIVLLSNPVMVYAYVSIGGEFQMERCLNSFSTYLPGKFGGYEGRCLRQGDIIQTQSLGQIGKTASRYMEGSQIRFVQGPEWDSLTTPFEAMSFQVSPNSNRMGIRLGGAKLESSLNEITSSAVIPGTVQLPQNGQPIVLLNDCQTTGGYPRIGTVLPQDLGKLGQIKPGKEITLICVN